MTEGGDKLLSILGKRFFRKGEMNILFNESKVSYFRALVFEEFNCLFDQTFRNRGPGCDADSSRRL